MKKNEEKKEKNKNSHMELLFAKQKKIIRHQFETSMESSWSNWQEFIENCRKVMR